MHRNGNAVSPQRHLGIVWGIERICTYPGAIGAPDRKSRMLCVNVPDKCVRFGLWRALGEAGLSAVVPWLLLAPR